MSKIISEFRGDYRFLSNFFSAPSGFNVEVRYQAAKTTNIKDYLQIMSLSPSQAKQHIKNVPVRDNWNQIRLTVMEELLRQKFSEREMALKLINTDDAILIEGNNWGDTFWGMCDGVGKNHLGKLLMKIRNEFLKIDVLLEY